MCVCSCVCVCVCVCVCLCLFVFVCVYVFMYECMCVCVFILCLLLFPMSKYVHFQKAVFVHFGVTCKNYDTVEPSSFEFWVLTTLYDGGKVFKRDGCQ